MLGSLFARRNTFSSLQLRLKAYKLFSSFDYNGPSISWFPGHIAKAQKELQEKINQVDVVIEILDARIPFSSKHPKLDEWIANRPKLMVLNHKDQVQKKHLKEWKEYYERKLKKEAYQNKQTDSIQSQLQKTYSQVFETNAKRGDGVTSLIETLARIGRDINKKRKEKDGFGSRPVRAVVVGYPNVGKSALINRISRTERVKSANRPGVTRHLQWVRIDQPLTNTERGSKLQDEYFRGIEVMDAPGIIPPNNSHSKHKTSGVKLAICNDIGEASYDEESVAIALIAYLIKKNKWMLFKKRYKIKSIPFVSDLKNKTTRQLQEEQEKEKRKGNRVDAWGIAEGLFMDMSDTRHSGHDHQCATKIMHDYRKGMFGPICLEYLEDMIQERTIEEIPELEEIKEREEKQEQEQKQTKRRKERVKVQNIQVPENPSSLLEGEYSGW